eukprot:5521505-Prymnesium_polylepis.1
MRLASTLGRHAGKPSLSRNHSGAARFRVRGRPARRGQGSNSVAQYAARVKPYFFFARRPHA